MTRSPVVTIFGSASPEPGDADYRLAYDVGLAVSEAGFIVCNGGRFGTMEASARGAKEATSSPLPTDKRTIGVIASGLGHREANRWIDTVITTDSLVDRLLRLVALGDGFIVLPGGTGTLLELAAVWEFLAKGLMTRKPLIVVGPFWEEAIATVVRQLRSEGRESGLNLIQTAADPAACVRHLRAQLEETTKGARTDGQ